MVTLDQAGRGLDWTTIMSPSPRLARLVEQVWITHHPPEVEGEAWRIVPDDRPHLLVHCWVESTTVSVVGPRSTGIEVPLRGRRWTLGVRLRAGTPPVLFGLPASELLDRSCRLRDLSASLDRIGRSRAYPPLGEALAQTTEAREAWRVVERRLGAWVERSSSIDWRARCLCEAPVSELAGVRIGTVAGRHGISSRALRAAAVHHVGLPPKAIQKVRRLQRAAALSLEAPERRWSEVAVAAGYYDEAHVHRDFRQLMGEAPESYRRRRARPIRTSPGGG